MEAIYKGLILAIVLSGCANGDSNKIIDQNTALKYQLDSINFYIRKENDQKRFFGKYTNHTKGLYKSFDFKGESSVMITDGIIGLPYATGYIRDGEIIRIKTDKSDLMLTIKDNNTLVGEGWAEGTYRKSNNEKIIEGQTKLIPEQTKEIPDKIKFYYTLKDRKSGKFIEVDKFPKNWDQKYDYVSSRSDIKQSVGKTKMDSLFNEAVGSMNDTIGK